MAISNGNTKLGKIPNFSLLPIIDCVNCEHCAKKCYALRAFNAYPSCRTSWQENSHLARFNPEAIPTFITDYLNRKRKNKDFFRWHVAGDIVGHFHFGAIVETARQNPNTKFLIFTKAFDFVRGKIPSNLTVILSLFPGMKPPPKRLRDFPRCYAGEVKDYPKNSRVSNAMHCPGSCESCMACWNLKEMGKDVRISIH